MGQILSFNPDRSLTFEPSRELGFDAERTLGFDPERSLGFRPNRDLGFGRRRVVFRGYVCPICESLTTEDAVRCSECGAAFEGEPRAAKPRPPEREVREEPAPAAVPSAGERGPVPPERRSAFCGFCGAKMHAGDAFCWRCGARSVAGRSNDRSPGPWPAPGQGRGPGEG